MRLGQIASVLGMQENSVPDVNIRKIAYDSRKIKQGDMFVAISGTKMDGHDFIDQAIAAGAVAVLAERDDITVPDGVTLLTCSNTRFALAKIAALMYGFPDRYMRNIGVTGTNGKTTTTKLIKYLLEQMYKKVGLIGTVNNMIGKEILPSEQTTPEPLALEQLLFKMRNAGCDDVVMEVSSHSLKQDRVAGCNYDVAVFTNLTQDHLDFHHTFEDYLQSKALLFKMLRQPANQYGVVNIDDAAAPAFIEACSVPVVTYGVDNEADLRAVNVQIDAGGTGFDLQYKGEMYHVHVPLSGKFNVYNSLAAIAVALGEGMSMTKILDALRNAPQVPGRFEKINVGQDFTVVVDYAHTPDGLDNVLRTAREITKNRLIVVFGCGGDRDRTKRPIMGRIAAELSDYAIVTSDNPRTEDPNFIISEVIAGLQCNSDKYTIHENRREAINLAIQMAEAGDVILIAGKGHEDYQLVGGEVLHFDDREEARLALKKKLGK